jgi:hypothetical protein
MKREQLYILHEKLCKQALGLMKLKNQDYAHGEDPFRNFRTSTVVGIEPERGILIRLLDKLTRAGNLIDKDPEVKDEKMEDTILDILNYTILFYAVNNERKIKK